MSRRGSSFHKETFQGVLNQYLLKFKEEERLGLRANLLLVISGVFGFAYISLGLLFINKFQFISFLPILFLYGYSVYFIAIPPSVYPWVKKSKFEDFERENIPERVYRSLNRQMYDLTGEIDILLRQTLYYIWRSVYLLSLSVLWTFIIYYLHNDPLLMFLIVIPPVSFILFIIIYSYWKLRIRKKLEKWMSMNQ
jgi:hypothetical protein